MQVDDDKKLFQLRNICCLKQLNDYQIPKVVGNITSPNKSVMSYIYCSIFTSKNVNLPVSVGGDRDTQGPLKVLEGSFSVPSRTHNLTQNAITHAAQPHFTDTQGGCIFSGVPACSTGHVTKKMKKI